MAMNLHALSTTELLDEISERIYRFDFIWYWRRLATFPEPFRVLVLVLFLDSFGFIKRLLGADSEAAEAERTAKVSALHSIGAIETAEWLRALNPVELRKRKLADIEEEIMNSDGENLYPLVLDYVERHRDELIGATETALA
jgi:hypothetical protein